MKFSSAIIAVMLLSASVVVPASAQKSALAGLDTDQPIDFDAARIEVQDTAKQAVLSGAVVIRQGRLTLFADRVRVLYAQEGANTAMQRLDARGNVRVESPSEKASGTNGTYDVASRLITLTGDVLLDRGGGNIARGQRLVLNLVTGMTSFDARAPGQASGGRVTGRFVVPPKKP
ncbi:LptA/OstA family protein [Sandarakinorhabdus sp.]|uniref:LptA/OstA family protein n=1 Tax=Sandarakinorhabdus sp. TaxID=1916663 RepID=UPI00286E87EE|nr:LptA/OstA family protein [Sandarakinorhabdus sp.]